jgi:hypothetical protein
MIASPTRLHCEPPPVAESKDLEDTWNVWRIVPEVVRLTSGAPKSSRLRGLGHECVGLAFSKGTSQLRAFSKEIIGSNFNGYAGRRSLLRLHLLGRIVLQAHGIDEV